MKRRTLDQMIETMKGVTAPPTFVPRLSRPRAATSRRVSRGLVVAGAAGIALALVFVRPAPAVAGGWSAAQEATRATRYVHSKFYEGDKLGIESWTALGGRSALVQYTNSVLTGEIRSDGKRVYRVFDFIATRGSTNVAINARTSGVVRDLSGRRSRGDQGPDSVEALLKRGKGRRMDPGLGGEGNWFEVDVPIGKVRGRDYAFHYQVRVGADGRLAERRLAGGTLRETFDYPASIPERTFEPRPQALKVPVIDIDATRREMERRIRAGSGERRGVDLRVALLDKEGTLFVFWTGPGVGEGTRGDVRLPGVRAKAARGIWAELAQFKSPARRGAAPGIGRSMPGRAIVPLERIGERIAVAIPGRGGEAVFRDVPVIRVDEIRYERKILGYEPVATVRP